MSLITLTTDFRTSSPMVGQMHGAIRSIAPEVIIVDLTHEIPRGDCQAAQLALEDAAPYFPDGTIHLAIVDELGPGGKSDEVIRPLIAQLGPQFFVGPDTGLITPLLQRAEANRWTAEVYHANQARYWRAHHPEGASGRDIYAALAGHLAKGMPLSELGERINDPLRANLPEPEIAGNGWRGEVLLIDHFGNLSANLKAFHLEGMGRIRVTVGGITIDGLSRTFGDGKPGDLIAMIDSSNRLSISVVNGSAAQRLGVRTGDPIEVQPIDG